MAKTVLVTKPIHVEALDRLKEEAHVINPFQAPRDELLALFRDVHGIIVGGILPLGGQEMDLARRLEVIGRHGVGLDNVDVAAASARSIPVVYTPYGPTESTAEHAVLLMLAASRRLFQLDHAVRHGDFAIRDRLEVMGHELQGQKLGVVGFGRIGQRVAEICRSAFDMSIHVYDPHLVPGDVAAWGAIWMPELTALAGAVDLLTIHVPLTPGTRHLINEAVIRAMVPGALLINTSRGPVVDEKALIAALLDGHLGGAGLDVYEPQPPLPDNPLLGLQQVVLTPHVASFTHEGRRRMGLTVVEDVLRVLRGEPPQYLANPMA
ncbi:hydroxyacid dehydrogenase [Chloroflexota bacterium]